MYLHLQNKSFCEIYFAKKLSEINFQKVLSASEALEYFAECGKLATAEMNSEIQEMIPRSSGMDSAGHPPGGRFSILRRKTDFIIVLSSDFIFSTHDFRYFQVF